MTTPTSPLDWYMRNAPRGTQDWTTGSTLTPAVGASGCTFTPGATETHFVDRVNVFMESGMTYTYVAIKTPNENISGQQNALYTQAQFELYCGGCIEVNNNQQEKFLSDSGLTFYKYELNFKPAVIMVGGSDYGYLSLTFHGISSGNIYVMPHIWRVLETDDGV